MAEGRIPPNFDESWQYSDVILMTDNSGGNVLYSNRTVLSIFSPVMAAMFSPGFNEANQDSVEIHVDYEAMKEILRNIFHIGLATDRLPLKTYDSTLLKEMYKAADFLDFGSIRELCLDHMRQKPTVAIAVAALELDIHDILMEILSKLDSEKLMEFLAINNSQLCFCKKDLTVVYNKIYNRGWATMDPEKPSEVVKLEEVAPDVENPRIDLTKKWFASDVAFVTRNSAERVLYANKGTLASLSQHFRELFFDERMLSKQFDALILDDEDRDFPVLSLDFEYATVKTILTIVHQCNADYTAESPTYNPALLYDMYRVASEDHLDMPNVQNMCIANLFKQPSSESLDVAVRLNLDIKTNLMQKMSGNELWEWYLFDHGLLTYRNVDEEVEITPRRCDIVLSLNDIRIIFASWNSQWPL